MALISLLGSFFKIFLAKILEYLKFGKLGLKNLKQQYHPILVPQHTQESRRKNCSKTKLQYNYIP
eukprot:snap_masked-scaffold_1-processed-gene-27.36-mRNA-1 protein AED:1.00 eAED:1.00 QI:0/0/0/0/1/1/2/0/64